jgi:hypothetical protein
MEARRRKQSDRRGPATSDDRQRQAPFEEPGDAGTRAIARRAYELYVDRGRRDGQDWEDWFQAEREIRSVKA